MVSSSCWGVVVGFCEGWGGELYRYTRGTLPTGESCSCDCVLLLGWCFLCVFFGLGRGQGLVYAHTGKERHTQVRELYL